MRNFSDKQNQLYCAINGYGRRELSNKYHRKKKLRGLDSDPILSLLQNFLWKFFVDLKNNWSVELQIKCSKISVVLKIKLSRSRRTFILRYLGFISRLNSGIKNRDHFLCEHFLYFKKLKLIQWIREVLEKAQKVFEGCHVTWWHMNMTLRWPKIWTIQILARNINHVSNLRDDPLSKVRKSWDGPKSEEKTYSRQRCWFLGWPNFWFLSLGIRFWDFWA